MSLRELGIFLKGSHFTKLDNAHFIADDFFGSQIAYFGVLKRFNGTSWVRAEMKVFNGSSFVQKPLRFFDGVEFKLIDSLG